MFTATTVTSALVLFFVGEVAIYVAIRLGLYAVVRDGFVTLGSARPGLRAIVHAVPIAVMAVAAELMNRPELAVGVVIGTSVAAMSLAVGYLCVVNPVGPAPGRWRRMWGFPLSAALIAFAAGFIGVLGVLAAAALVVEGIALCLLWMDKGGTPAETVQEGPSGGGAGRVALALPALLLAVGGPLWLLHGIVAFERFAPHSSPATLSVALLSLGLAMPMIYTGRSFAVARQSWLPMTTQTGIVLINLCAILPLVVLTGALRWRGGGYPVPYPLGEWRIDTLLLVVVCLLQLPVALGRWSLGRMEGLALICVYLVYVFTGWFLAGL